MELPLYEGETSRQAAIKSDIIAMQLQVASARAASGFQQWLMNFAAKRIERLEREKELLLKQLKGKST